MILFYKYKLIFTRCKQFENMCVFIKKLIKFLAALGPHCCPGFFCSCGAQASHCGDCSFRRAWALGSVG